MFTCMTASVSNQDREWTRGVCRAIRSSSRWLALDRHWPRYCDSVPVSQVCCQSVCTIVSLSVCVSHSQCALLPRQSITGLTLSHKQIIFSHDRTYFMTRLLVCCSTMSLHPLSTLTLLTDTMCVHLTLCIDTVWHSGKQPPATNTTQSPSALLTRPVHGRTGAV